jgi:hypothetical protein
MSLRATLTPGMYHDFDKTTCWFQGNILQGLKLWIKISEHQKVYNIRYVEEQMTDLSCCIMSV